MDKAGSFCSMQNAECRMHRPQIAHNSKQSKEAVAYLEYINSIVENSVLLDSYGIGKQKSENSVMMHSLYAIADIGNGNELIKLYVEELNDVNSNGTIKRSYQLQNITNQQLSVKGSSNALASSSSTADIKTISDLFAIVKQNDKNFNPNPISIVVNDDGTPEVLYHQTANVFTVFDIRHEGVGTSDNEKPIWQQKMLLPREGKNKFLMQLPPKNLKVRRMWSIMKI